MIKITARSVAKAFFINPAIAICGSNVLESYFKIIMCMNKCTYEYSISIWSKHNEHMNVIVAVKWEIYTVIVFFVIFFLLSRELLMKLQLLCWHLIEMLKKCLHILHLLRWVDYMHVLYILWYTQFNYTLNRVSL